MKGTIKIEKSFDYGKEFSKLLMDGDFEEFFREEGEYLDSLVKIAERTGEEFTITYSVKVTA